MAALLRSSSALARPSRPKKLSTPTSQVEDVLTRYRAAKSVKARVKKTVTQELMGSTHVSEGLFYFAKGKLRLDLTKPEPSILVYDGKNIWLESHLDAQTIEVSHMRAGALKRSDSLMASLFDKKDALKGFRLLQTHAGDGYKSYSFTPKDKSTTEIRSLEVELRGPELKRIKYKDQMENTVDFEFGDLSHEAVDLNLFVYKPPAGANVTELK